MAGKDDPYKVFTLRWSEFDITVEHQRNWLNTGNWHIQLRCNKPLPVTQTGYRSIFVADVAFENEEEIKVNVVALLDEAAQSKAWLAYVEDSQQLKLF